MIGLGFRRGVKQPAEEMGVEDQSKANELKDCDHEEQEVINDSSPVQSMKHNQHLAVLQLGKLHCLNSG
jgi:hypothetical protein